MVVWLVTHGNLFLSDLSPQLTVHEGNPASWGRSLFLKYAAHMPEELGCAGEERRGVVHVVKKILSVLITLSRRQREPAGGGVKIFR